MRTRRSACRPSTSPVYCGSALSGGYAVQARSPSPPSTKKNYEGDDRPPATTPRRTDVQLGTAMSLAPDHQRDRNSEGPARIGGMITRDAHDVLPRETRSFVVRGPAGGVRSRAGSHAIQRISCSESRAPRTIIARTPPEHHERQAI